MLFIVNVRNEIYRVDIKAQNCIACDLTTMPILKKKFKQMPLFQKFVDVSRDVHSCIFEKKNS